MATAKTVWRVASWRNACNKKAAKYLIRQRRRSEKSGCGNQCAAPEYLGYHDRSDGGLLACVAEMAFAGQTGLALNVDMLLAQGDGISDSHLDTGDAKNCATQIAARRQEATLQALFNEELGVVIQVA